MGIFDVVGIVSGAASPSDIGGRLLDDMAEGILKVMRYIDSLNMVSLNMSLYFHLGTGLFTPHLRICPRVNIPPFDTSQINYMGMLHGETLTILRPEDICAGIRDFWDS
jgi:galactose-1-phosphate uridylyltransferase